MCESPICINTNIYISIILSFFSGGYPLVIGWLLVCCLVGYFALIQIIFFYCQLGVVAGCFAGYFVG